ncbi:MAG TPA: LamG-like jellyroll fold domain-containing protein [Chloroflexota bacterium]
MPAFRSIRAVLGRAIVVAATILSAASPAAAPRVFADSPDIVISQVYGGGGNSGATLTNDFVELFNRGSSPVSVGTWSVQYASAAGNTWQRTNLTGTIQPGQYYLVQESQGAGGTTPLPTPDATGTILMSATSAKVALVTNQTNLTCGTGCVPNAVIRDFVGYGSTASSFEGGAPAPTLTNTTAAMRGTQGCTDTDDNAADFSSGAPTPRNSASALHVCPADTAPTVRSTSPADDAVDVALDGNISITFSEPVNVSGDWFGISCSHSGAHTATTSGGPTTFTLDPATDFARSDTCTVTVRAAQVTDQDALDPPDAMDADAVFSFVTIGLEGRRIHDVQGSAHISPLNGERVAAVPGIVTAVRTNGFYYQDPNADGDVATSEGIFVFTSSAPSAAVGDSLTLNGTVSEFRPGGAATNLTITELTRPAITTLSSGNGLPAPIVIGRGGRVPPSTIIEDDASVSVESSGVFDPAQDGIDFYESLEGMRVQVNNAVVSGPTNSFQEIPVLADDGLDAALRTPRGGVLVRPTDFNPERIVVDDEIIKLSGGTIPPVDVGDHFNGSLVGVVDYNFGNFMVELTTAPTVTAGGIQPETTNVTVGASQLSVATFNVENLDTGDAQAKFDQLAALIVTNLRAPDLVALEEVQDNNGPTNDGTVDPSQTLARLTTAIQAAGGPSYEFRQINPVNNQDGGEPGGNIRVVFLFRTDRGLSFVDRPGGGSTNAVGVVSGPTGPQLTFSPGRIDPTNSAFNTSRKPLAGEFAFNSRHLFVVANHFNSKGGDQPLFGQFQPPNRISEVQRHQQAQIVHDFVGSILAVDATADVVVLGDLNDFDFSDTLTILKTGVLNELMELLPAAERYTYDFEGNSQSLDHILTSNHLVNTAAPAYDIVHVNAEFSALTRASDHDPQVVRFNLTPGSLLLNGTTAYADAPHAAELDITGDWTIETWFKEESPLGFNHDYVQLLNKGDRDSNPESPYYITLGFKRLVAGLRSGSVDYSVAYDLRAGGVDPNTWHHVASSFQASTRTLTLYLDGQQVAQIVLASGSRGNSLPVQIGRNGPTGKYFRGRLEDVRIWNVVRTSAEIAGTYRTEFSSAPSGLVANWKLNEGGGPIAADSAGGHTATLHGGAVLTPDGHP